MLHQTFARIREFPYIKDHRSRARHLRCLKGWRFIIGTNMAHILVIEDDPPSREVITEVLEFDGHQVVATRTAEEGLRHLPQVDLVVVDVMLPGMSGMDFTETARRLKPDIPILMLTSLAHQGDRIAGFKSGIDDYLTKPYDVTELLLRIKALLRRSGRSEVMQRGPYQIDVSERSVYHQNKAIDLSRLEFDLLITLARSPGKAFSREELFEKVWSEESDALVRSVDVKIADLRRKMGDASWIQTVWGVGYRFKPDRDRS